MAIPEPIADAAGDDLGRGIVLPCVLLFGAMFNLTLVVAGLKEFILDDLGGSIADATLFFSVETFSYILFAPVWGLLSDRLGVRRPLVVLGFLLSAGIYFLYGTIHSIGLLLVLRFAQGAFSVMGWSTVMAMILDCPVRGRQGRYLGLMGASLIFGVALGAPAGGYLTRWFGARAPLEAAAVLFTLLALLALLLTERRPVAERPGLGLIFRALRDRPLIAVPMMFHFVDRLAVGLFVVIFPLYLDALGAGDAAIRGRYLSFFLVPFAFLQYFTGRLAERTGPLPPLLLGSLVYGILLCTVGYSDLFTLKPVMLGLGIFAAVMFPPAILLTARLSDPLTRGSAMGGFNLAGSLGFAVGPLLGAWAYAVKGFGFAFVLCGATEILVALAGVAFLGRRADLG